MVDLLGGSLKKKSMYTIPFNLEMRILGYIMIHNLYPVMNLTTLAAPRTTFLYDLFTHKKIDICGHIFHLLTIAISKRTLRNVMPFPSLIMGLIANRDDNFSPPCLTRPSLLHPVQIFPTPAKVVGQGLGKILASHHGAG